MKTPPKALGVKTRTEPSHSWLSGLLLPGQTINPPPTARSHGARQPGDYSRPAIPARQPARPMGLQGLRDRSRCSAEAWWRRFAGKYAVAVAFVGARKGPDRIAPHSGYNCSACLTGRTSCSLATTLGCSTPEGRLGTPRYQARELLIGIILRSRAASRERASNPIRRRSSRSAEGDAAADRHAADGPARDSVQGGAGHPIPRELLIVAILQSSAVSRKGTISRPISMRLADRCFGPCGTAVRRLPGTPVGDTPICVGFRGARGKRSAGDAETWLNALSPSSDFEYLVIPARNFQRPISIGGGMAMKQEMNESFTFDRLYWRSEPFEADFEQQRAVEVLAGGQPGARKSRRLVANH